MYYISWTTDMTFYYCHDYLLNNAYDLIGNISVKLKVLIFIVCSG